MNKCKFSSTKPKAKRNFKMTFFPNRIFSDLQTWFLREEDRRSDRVRPGRANRSRCHRQLPEI